MGGGKVEARRTIGIGWVMSKNWSKVVAWVGYAVVVGWRAFAVAGWQFVVGNIVAVGLLLVDKIVYAWWLYPFEQSSIQIQYWMRKKDLKAVLGLLVHGRLNQHKLMLKSVGFAVIWVLLAIFVASSTGSVVAMGIVMGLGFDLAWSIVRDWKNPAVLGAWYCWQIKRAMSEKEVRWCGGIFVMLWLLFVVRLVLA